MATMVEYSFRTCPICGIHYAVDKTVMDYKYGLERGHANAGWCCPNGHSLVFTESAADKWRREHDRLAQRIAQRDDEIAATNRQLTAAKGQITKLQKRASAGVCPCCTRSFTNLARHMKTKHPAFGADNVVELKAG